LREILESALRRPEQMALHVVGTAETDRVFAMMESLAPASTWRDKRVRIEHGDGIRAGYPGAGGAARRGRYPKSDALSACGYTA
jgi:hypothetical protein